MQDGIKSFQISALNVTNVFLQRGNRRDFLAKSATRKKIAIKPDDFVPGGLQHRHHSRSDIAAMSGNQYAHCFKKLVNF
jgi:hypothetical protein